MKIIKQNLILTILFVMATMMSAHAQWNNGGNCFGGSPDVFGTTCAEDIQFILNGGQEGMLDMQGNVFFGQNTGSGNTGGVNTGLGSAVLSNSLTGSVNVAVGYGCLNGLQSGDENIALGGKAMADGTSGDNNIALGMEALRTNNGHSNSIAIGTEALYSNQSDLSVGIGYYALYSNTTGYGNTATGVAALYSNVYGDYNSAFGYKALDNHYKGPEDVGVGVGAGISDISGNDNTYVGAFADANNSSYYNATALGAGAVVDAVDKVRVGNTSVTVIEGQVNWSFPSDGRFKNNVTETVKGLEFINKLRPVQYNFEAKKFDEFVMKNMTAENRENLISKNNYSKAEAVHYSGFIAQEVEQVSKETGYDFSGVHTPQNDNEHYSMSYSDFVVPLVKSVQELSADNDAKTDLISKQQSQIDEQTTQIDQLNSRITLLEQMMNKQNGGQIQSSQPSLGQNQPNPTDRNTSISYYVPTNSGAAYITVNDLKGQEMQRLQITQFGNGTVTVRTENLQAGNYLYSLVINGSVIDSKQMTIVK